MAKKRAKEKPKDVKLEVVIPSRQRSHLIPRAMSHFIDPIICVDEKEADTYQKALGKDVRIITHPGYHLPRIRQHIMDTVEADVIFQCDDDLKMVKALPGNLPHRLRDPEKIREVIMNAAMNAREAGTILFAFEENLSSKWYSPHRPFRLHGQIVGCNCGLWREEFNRHVRYDPTIRRENVDLVMRTIIKYRFTWVDTRYAFVPGPHVVSKTCGIKSTTDSIDIANQQIVERYGDQVVIDPRTRTIRLRLPFSR